MDSQARKQIRNEQIARGLQDPSKAFNTQRNNAKSRGIEWQMSFEQWWGIWKDYYYLRGTGTNGLVMARKGDYGPYSVENVYLTTNLGNVLDYSKSPEAVIRRHVRRLEGAEKAGRAAFGKRLWSGKESGLTMAKNFWGEEKPQNDDEVA